MPKEMQLCSLKIAARKRRSTDPEAQLLRYIQSGSSRLSWLNFRFAFLINPSWPLDETGLNFSNRIHLDIAIIGGYLIFSATSWSLFGSPLPRSDFGLFPFPLATFFSFCPIEQMLGYIGRPAKRFWARRKWELIETFPLLSNIWDKKACWKAKS